MIETKDLASRNEPPLALGSCILANPVAAQIVQESILFFERQRYLVSSWCIMPNHVHVIVTPIGDATLNSVLQSWKGFSARKINEKIGREGSLWERESFDHAVRKPYQLDYLIRYIEDNPVKAGLCDRPEDWPWSSRGAGFSAHPLMMADPRKLPFVPVIHRGELPHLYKQGATYYVTFRLLDAVVASTT